jgi:hypothetical protein
MASDDSRWRRVNTFAIVRSPDSLASFRSKPLMTPGSVTIVVGGVGPESLRSDPYVLAVAQLPPGGGE